MELRLIKTEEDHKAFLAEVERLVALDPATHTPDAYRLELLATLVENYEKEHFPIGKPTPIEAILFRMEEQGLEQKDLIPYIGSKSKVSEVLSGKRGLTLRMVRALNQGLGIPLEVLTREPDTTKRNSIVGGGGPMDTAQKARVEMHTGEEYEIPGVTHIESGKYNYEVHRDRKVLAVLNKFDVKNLILIPENQEQEVNG